MRPRLKMRLGDLLVHENIISSEQLDEALATQRTTGRKLGDTLINLKQTKPEIVQTLDVLIESVINGELGGGGDSFLDFDTEEKDTGSIFFDGKPIFSAIL